MCYCSAAGDDTWSDQTAASGCGLIASNLTRIKILLNLHVFKSTEQQTTQAIGSSGEAVKAAR